jgi:hypothetical protein
MRMSARTTRDTIRRWWGIRFLGRWRNSDKEIDMGTCEDTSGWWGTGPKYQNTGLKSRNSFRPNGALLYRGESCTCALRDWTVLTFEC